MELNELSTSLAVEYIDCVSESVEGNSPNRYDVRREGRDVSVDIVVRCVAVLVSKDTMIFEGSEELLGTGDTRMALKGAWGEGTTTPAGSGGTGGNKSNGDLCGRRGGVVLTGARSESKSGIDGIDGGGRMGGGGCTAVGMKVECESIVSASSPSSNSSSIYSASLSGIGGSGGLPGR